MFNNILSLQNSENERCFFNTTLLRNSGSANNKLDLIVSFVGITILICGLCLYYTASLAIKFIATRITENRNLPPSEVKPEETREPPPFELKTDPLNLALIPSNETSSISTFDFQTLPKEIQALVFSHSDPYTLSQWNSVSKYFTRIVNDNVVWEFLCKREKPEIELSKGINIWKLVYEEKISWLSQVNNMTPLRDLYGSFCQFEFHTSDTPSRLAYRAKKSLNLTNVSIFQIKLVYCGKLIDEEVIKEFYDRKELLHVICPR